MATCPTGTGSPTEWAENTNALPIGSQDIWFSFVANSVRLTGEAQGYSNLVKFWRRNARHPLLQVHGAKNVHQHSEGNASLSLSQPLIRLPGNSGAAAYRGNFQPAPLAGYLD